MQGVLPGWVTVRAAVMESHGEEHRLCGQAWRVWDLVTASPLPGWGAGCKIRMGVRPRGIVHEEEPSATEERPRAVILPVLYVVCGTWLCVAGGCVDLQIQET